MECSIVVNMVVPPIFLGASSGGSLALKEVELTSVSDVFDAGVETQ
jgi:hypothetical protein